MPAVPAIIMGGASLGSAVVGAKAANSAAKKASQRSPEELALLQSQTKLSEQMGAQGRQLFGTAMPQIRSTIDYYRTLLDGSRAARMNAVSGEAQDTAEAFQGADANIKQNLRGGEREQALAENSRARAGQIARLVTGVRPGAASALGNLSSGLISASQGFEGAGAEAGSNLLTNSTQNRQFGYEAGQRTGANVSNQLGKILGNILGSIKFGGGPRQLSSSPIPNLPSTLPLPAGPPSISY